MKAEWKVIPRVEKKYLPGAMMPAQRIAGYDLVEYCDGTEVRRHEYSTKEEAELFAANEREQYLAHLESIGKAEIPSPVIVCLTYMTVIILTVVMVRLVLWLIGL